MKRVLYSIIFFVCTLTAQPPLSFDAEPVPMAGGEYSSLFFRAPRFFTFDNNRVQVVQKKNLDWLVQRVQTYRDLKQSLHYGYYRVLRTDDNKPYVVYHPRMSGGGPVLGAAFSVIGGVIGGFIGRQIAEYAFEALLYEAGQQLGIAPEDVPQSVYYLYQGGKMALSIYDTAKMTHTLAKGGYDVLYNADRVRQFQQAGIDAQRDINTIINMGLSPQETARQIILTAQNYQRVDPVLAADIVGAPTVEYVQYAFDTIAEAVTRDPEAALRFVDRAKKVSFTLGAAALGAYETIFPTAKEVLEENKHKPDEIARTLSSVRGGVQERRVDNMVFDVVKTQNSKVSYGVAVGQPDKQALFVTVDGVEIPIPIGNKVDFKRSSIGAEFGKNVNQVLDDRYFKPFEHEIFVRDDEKPPVLETIGFAKDQVVVGKEEIPVLSDKEYVSMRERALNYTFADTSAPKTEAASSPKPVSWAESIEKYKANTARSGYISHDEMLRQQDTTPKSEYISHAEMEATYDHYQGEEWVDPRQSRGGRPIVYREATPREQKLYEQRLPHDFDYFEHVKSYAKVSERPEKEQMIEELKDAVRVTKQRDPALDHFKRSRQLKGIKTGKDRYVPSTNHSRGYTPKPAEPVVEEDPSIIKIDPLHPERTESIPINAKVKIQHPKNYEELMQLVEKEADEKYFGPDGELLNYFRKDRFMSLKEFDGSKEVQCGEGKLYVAEYLPEFDRSGAYKEAYKRMLQNTIQNDFKAAQNSFASSTSLAGMADAFKGIKIDVAALEKIKDNRQYIEAVFEAAHKILNGKIELRANIQLQYDPGIQMEKSIMQGMDTDEITVSVDGAVQTLDQNYSAINMLKESKNMLNFSESLYQQYKDNEEFIKVLREHMSELIKGVAEKPDWSFSISNAKSFAPALAVGALVAHRAATQTAEIVGAKAGASFLGGLGFMIPFF